MGTKYKIESSFEYRGFPCLGLFYEYGHRCGYVGVPPEHPFYEMEGWTLDDITEAGMLDCNGGTTFFSHHPKFDEAAGVENYWWIGWDYHHGWDALDFDAWKEHFPEKFSYAQSHGLARRNDYMPYSRTAKIETVKYDCMKVVDQIIDGRYEDE